MPKQARHLHDGEVGAEADGVERVRCFSQTQTVDASNSKHAVNDRRGTPMKAVRFHEYGDAGVLRYEDVGQPVPGDGEVRVRVAATSFNPVDGNIRAGYMQ